jgi:hypothetical protein
MRLGPKYFIDELPISVSTSFGTTGFARFDLLLQEVDDIVEQIAQPQSERTVNVARLCIREWFQQRLLHSRSDVPHLQVSPAPPQPMRHVAEPETFGPGTFERQLMTVVLSEIPEDLADEVPLRSDLASHVFIRPEFSQPATDCVLPSRAIIARFVNVSDRQASRATQRVPLPEMLAGFPTQLGSPFIRIEGVSNLTAHGRVKASFHGSKVLGLRGRFWKP